MGTVTEFTNMDFKTLVQLAFIFISGAVAIYKIIGEFSIIIKKPVSWVKKNEADHELLLQTVQEVKELKEQHDESVKQSIRHDEMIREDLQKLSDTVEGIVDTLAEMQAKNDKTEMVKLKEQILAYYKKYKDEKEWDSFECEVFWGLYDSYISHGGNSFVEKYIEPVMRELNIK